MRSDFHHKERVVVNNLRNPHVKERFMKTKFFYPAYPDKEVIRKQPLKIDIESDASPKKRMKISINYRQSPQVEKQIE